jgi:hypothetical protein
MKVIQLACICFAMLIASSCKNDIEINAPWKETPVVYAFIDPNTNTQFFRIEKTYQNSTDLTTDEGAKIADSLYFDTLIVKVFESGNTYTFTKTKNVPKDDGFFASGAHFLYQCNNFTGILNHNYTLQLFSPKTGKTYNATTTCIGPSRITAARLRFDGTNPSQTSVITTTDIVNSEVNNQTMSLIYLEYPTGGTGGDTLRADYNFSVDTIPYRIKANVFINAVKDLIPVKSAVERKVIRIDFVNIGGGKELKDLIELGKPTLDVVQKKPDYSNVTDALGIFSSRSYKYTTNIETFESQWPAQKQLLINALNAVDYQGIKATNLNFVP